jgi:hypothetical protein
MSDPSDARPFHLPTTAVPVETNLIRKAYFRLGPKSGSALKTTDNLGSTEASGELRLLDIEVLGWLSAHLPRHQRALEFSRDDLADDLYRRRLGGSDRAALTQSLARLVHTHLTFGGYDATERRFVTPVAFSDVRLLDAVQPARCSRNGQPLTWTARFQPWLLNQMALGYVTFVDWTTMRNLHGLAKRLWLYAQGETPRAKYKGRVASYLILNDTGERILGMAYTDRQRAKDALRRATAKIEQTDSSLAFAITGGHPPYTLFMMHDGNLRHERRRRWAAFDPSAMHVGSIRRPWKNIKLEPSNVVVGDLETSNLEDFLEPPNTFVVIVPHDRTVTAKLHRTGCYDLEPIALDPPAGEYIFATQLTDIWRWYDRQRLPRPRTCPVCRPT